MWKRLLVIAIGIGLFLWILSGVNVPKTLEILKQTNWVLCLLALAMVVGTIYLRAIRWSYLLKMQGYSYSTWNSFLVYMSSMFWGNVTPGRAGDFIKVFYLKEDLNVPMGKSMASVLVDRVLDLYLLLFLGGIGILTNPMPTDADSAKMILAVKILFVILTLISLLAFNKKIGGILLKAAFQRLMKQAHREKTDKLFEDFHQGMEAFYKPSILWPALLSFVAYIPAFWGCSLMAQSIGLNLSIFYLAFVISVVNIVSLLTILGLGTRDAALIILFGLVSLSKEQAIAYSMLMLFIGTILFTAICFFCSLVKPLRFKNKD